MPDICDVLSCSISTHDQAFAYPIVIHHALLTKCARIIRIREHSASLAVPVEAIYFLPPATPPIRSPLTSIFATRRPSISILSTIIPLYSPGSRALSWDGRQLLQIFFNSRLVFLPLPPSVSSYTPRESVRLLSFRPSHPPRPRHRTAPYYDPKTKQPKYYNEPHCNPANRPCVRRNDQRNCYECHDFQPE